MNESTSEPPGTTPPNTTPSNTTPSNTTPSNRAWQIAVGVLAVLLVIAVLFIVLRRDESEKEVTGGTTTTTEPTDATASDSSMGDPYQVECTADALLAAIPADGLAEGAEVAHFGCAPAAEGAGVDAYAWAELNSPGVEPLVAFYSGRGAIGSGTPDGFEWTVLTYGTAVFCEDVIPTETCDMLPGARRQGDAGGAASTSPDASSGTASGTASGDSADGAESRVYAMECTASDLSAAVPPDVLAPGANVTTFACTPSQLAGADTAFAFLRAEAPGVDPIVVLFTATALVEPGSATVVDWNATTWGSAVACEDYMPAEACDQLAGVPRR